MEYSMPMMPACQARPCHALPAVSCAREACAATLQQASGGCMTTTREYITRPERALVSIAHKYSLNTFNDKGKRWWVYNEFVTASSHRVMGRVEPDRVHVGVVVKCVGDGDGTDSRRWR